MNNNVLNQDVLDRLEEQKIEYEVLDLHGGFKIIVTVRGGRILGPFKETGESLLWLNKAFKNKDEFDALIKNNEWNIGGDRLWIAPELPFFCRKKIDFDNSYVVQPQMDPGNYQFEPWDGGVKLSQDVDIPVFEMAFDTKQFNISKMITRANNPLQYLDNVEMDGVEFCGYEQDVEIEDVSPHAQMYLEPWFLTQINPGGSILIPYFGVFEYIDYYEPVDDTIQIVHENYVEVRVTGDRKFKTGYKSANTMGRAVYINRLVENQYYAIFRNFHNDPGNPYACAPWHDKSKKGCSMFVYNDDNNLGGFAEFENSGLTMKSSIKKVRINSKLSEWFFIGGKAQIESVIYRLLGLKHAL